MKNKFFLNSIGVATIIFALAFLIRSIAPANAAPKPAEFITEGANQIGKYQIQYNEGVDNNNVFYFHALIWDTETGKSSVYGWNRDKQVWEDFFTGSSAVPSTIK
jgi:hypothetical protein